MFSSTKSGNSIPQWKSLIYLKDESGFSLSTSGTMGEEGNRGTCQGEYGKGFAKCKNRDERSMRPFVIKAIWGGGFFYLSNSTSPTLRPSLLTIV